MAGIPAIEVWDWTFGEVMAQIRADAERLRRGGQLLANVATGEAAMIAAHFSDGSNQEIWEAFPFWTDAEIAEYKVEKYRKIMEKCAAGGVKRV